MGAAGGLYENNSILSVIGTDNRTDRLQSHPLVIIDNRATVTWLTTI